jgi:GNAT superfamily N-acetyltransferase
MPAKPADMLTFAPPDRRRRQELYDFIAKVFSGGRGYFGFRDYLTKGGYIEDSLYDWSASRVGLLDGRMVTHVGVWDYRMRIGAARVRSGGLGVVATHGDFRKQGLMALTMDATVQAMRQAGYDVSVLFGISDFYHRFGYTRAWNEVSWTVKVEDLPKDPPVGPVRHMALRQRRADLEALYNRHYAAVTGTAVRPTYARRPTCKITGWLWCHASGMPAGYVAVQNWPEAPEVVEHAGQAQQVLHVLGRQCRQYRIKELKFVGLPWDGELAGRLRKGNVRLAVEYARCGGAMIRVINLASILAKLCGELSRRLRASGQKGWAGRLRIQMPREAADLICRQGRIGTVSPSGKADHAIRGGWEVAQLLIGAGDPLEIADSHGIVTTGQARRLLPLLFADQHPVMCRWDLF